MKLLLFFFGLFLVCCIPPSNSEGRPEVDISAYLEQRQALLNEDLSRMLGSNIELDANESAYNDILMKFKNEEMKIAFETLDFPPSESFFLSKKKIDKSPVFSIIKDMPKGAALHLHELALASVDWVISEISYWDDLYLCNRSGEPLLYKFFDTPDASCEWELLSEARTNHSSVEAFDQLLKNSISIITDSPEDYQDINFVWNKFNSAFISIAGLVSYAPAWESFMNRFFYEFMTDNVLYVEFRGVLDLLYDKNGRVYNEIETFEVYDRAIKKFSSENSDKFFGAKYIHTILKVHGIETMWEAAKTMIDLKERFPDTIAGFDLVGQEDPSPPTISLIEPLLHLLNQDPPIPFFCHAGETNWHGMVSDENLIDVILLNCTRIGHGYALTKHPLILEKLREANIPLEVCPISNQVLMLVEDLRNHPVASLVADNFPIVISSDDNAFWGADPLSHDFYEAFYAFGGAKADLRFLKQLAINSIEYSALSEDQKEALMDLWRQKWDHFIATGLSKFAENS